MIPFRKSLAFRLMILSFILLALPLLVDSFIIVQRAYKGAIVDAKRNLVEVATSRAIPLAEMQPAKKLTLNILESFLQLKEHFPAASDDKLNRQLAELVKGGNFTNIFLLKLQEDGKFIVTATNDSTYQNKDYTDLVRLMDIYSPETYSLGFFSFLSYNSVTFQPYFLVGRGVYSSGNKLIGIILISSNIAEKLEKLLAPHTGKYTVNFALLLPSTIVFASSDPTLQFQYFVPIDEKFRTQFAREEVFANQLINESPIEKISLGYPFFEFVWKGEKQVGYISKLSTSSISLLAYASREAIFVQPFVDFLDVYAIYLLILIIGGALAYFLTRRLARPMFHLGSVMLAIQKGNLETRYQSDPVGYEINAVGEIFNQMIETLFQKKKLVQQERVEKETYAQELRIGQQVQRSLLIEKTPNYPGVELARRYIPAKEVGGDFFDVFVKKTKDEDILALAIADTSGKGIRACFYSLGVRSMLRTYAKEFDDVAQVMTHTNSLFCLDTGDTGMFVTVLMGYYNNKTRELSYYSCGHNPLLLRKNNGDVIALNHMGMAMGIECTLEATAHKIQLHKGDVVLFYTDGITEAHDSNFRMFSDERLQRFLKEEGTKKPSEMADKLLEEIRLFVGNAPQHDDITLLIMKII